MNKPRQKAKLSRSHTTSIAEVERLLPVLREIPNVTKLSRGEIAPVGPAQPWTKITQESGALLLKVRGSTAVQLVRCYAHKDHMRQVMEDVAKAIRGQGMPVAFKKNP